MKFLSILFCAASVSAFAQPNNALYKQMTSQMEPQLKQILNKQMATHGMHKTTANGQRLVGYSNQDLQNGGGTDSSYLGYSGLRGSTFANCMENAAGYDGSFSKPDTVLIFQSGALTSNLRYTYDNKDSVLNLADLVQRYRYDYTLDNSGNTIVADYYDTVNNNPSNTTTYAHYDNQHRKVYDSTEAYSKTVSGYGQGIDSSIYYSWDNSLSLWYPVYKDLNIYDNGGHLITFYEFTADTTSASWDSLTRINYTYNSNGFVTQALQEGYTQGWENQYREILDYTGNNPLYTSYEYDFYNQNSGWEPNIKHVGTPNSSGNWDAFYYLSWNNIASTWDSMLKTGFTYNNYDYVTKLEMFVYDNASGSFDPNPVVREKYYYKTVVPDAVNTVQTASSAITAYPNPASNKLHLDGNIGSKNVSMQLISVTGARLFNTSGNWQSLNKDIDMSAFATGVYYLLIADENGNKIATKQIVKN